MPDATFLTAGRSAAATAVLVRPGARLAYEVTGDGPAVVLIHGFSLDMRTWDAQAGPLAARFRVVRYDCRGFGASGPLDPAVAYAHVDDLVALLDHLGIEDAALVGLSFGGQLAVEAALAAPDRVRRLALLSSVLDGVPWDAESWAALRKVARQVDAHGVLAGREAWLDHPLFAAAREQPAVAGRLAAMVASYPGQHWLGQDPHRRPDSRAFDALEGVTVPTLVVSGQRDVPGFREMSAVLAARIPGAEHHVVPGAGHLVNMEQPDIVNDLLARFLASPGKG
jgi:pimeloyl-ACP methyl ester carboxylesterase